MLMSLPHRLGSNPVALDLKRLKYQDIDRATEERLRVYFPSLLEMGGTAELGTF